MPILLAILYFYPFFFRRSSAVYIACLYMWFSHPVMSNSGHIRISSSAVYWAKINGILLEIYGISFSCHKAEDNLCYGFYRRDELCMLKLRKQKTNSNVSKKPWRCRHTRKAVGGTTSEETLWENVGNEMPTDARKANLTQYLQGSLGSNYHCKRGETGSGPEPASRKGQDKARHCPSL